MPPFDPKEFLKGNTSEPSSPPSRFDPKEYLRNNPPVQDSTPKEIPTAPPSFSSLTEQAGVGMFNAATGLAGLPGDIGQAIGATGGGYPFPEYSPSSVIAPALSRLPGQKQIQNFLEPITGPVPPSQNVYEDYARTFGEFFPLAAGGEATLFQRIARVLTPTATAESAKQAAKKIGAPEPIQEWAKFVGAVTPTTLSYLWRTAPDRMEGAMNQLFDLSRDNYNHPDVKGLKIKIPAAQTEAFNIANELFDKYGMRAGPVADEINRLALPQTVVAKQTMESEAVQAKRLVNEGVPLHQALQTAKGGKPHIDYQDIASVRERLSRIMENFNEPHEQLLARVAKSKIDHWMTTLGQDDLVAGNAAKATERLKDARSDWWAAESLKTLGTKIYQGVIGAGTSYSGQNLENSVRQRIGSILKREKEYPTGQFTADEIEKLERAASPKGLEQLARRVSKMLPRHGGFSTLLGAVLGEASGHPLAGAAAGYGTGALAGSIENKLANRVVRDVQEEIVKRSASGSQVRLPDTRHDILGRAALGRPEDQQSDDAVFRFDSQGNRQ